MIPTDLDFKIKRMEGEYIMNRECNGECNSCKPVLDCEPVSVEEMRAKEKEKPLLESLRESSDITSQTCETLLAIAEKLGIMEEVKHHFEEMNEYDESNEHYIIPLARCNKHKEVLVLRMADNIYRKL